MSRLVTAWLIAGACCLAFSQTPASQERTAEEAADLRIVFPSFAYPDRVSSIRLVDFRNLLLHVFDERGKVQLSAQLKDGLSNKREASGIQRDWFALVAISYVFGDGNADKPQHAVAVYDWVSAGASSVEFQVVQLYQVEGGRFTVVQQIRTYNRLKGGAWFDPVSRRLTVKATDYRPESSAPLHTFVFRWDGSKFVRQHATRQSGSPPLRGPVGDSD